MNKYGGFRCLLHLGSLLSVLGLFPFTLAFLSDWLTTTPTPDMFMLNLSVEEGLPVGTLVGDLAAGSLRAPFFMSVSYDSPVLADLDVDPDSGLIRTAIVLDRELRAKYEFAAATLLGQVVHVRIQVLDVNDNPPSFSHGHLQLQLSEQSPPGTRLQLEGAQDPDEGAFSIQGYMISSGDPQGVFELLFSKRENDEGSSKLELVLTGQLDRETTDLYTLVIEALDGGEPPLTGRLHLQLSVTDENDNPPKFSQAEYRVQVWENAEPGSAVTQIHASDPDQGDNGAVIYEINRRLSDPDLYFAIEPTSGLIILNRTLDHERQSMHQLIIQARDQGSPPEVGSVFVLVQVLDINDNSPIIDILFLTEDGEPAISEGARPGDYVARITLSDPDLGLEAPSGVHVSLQGANDAFVLRPATTDDMLYFLCVSGLLDRESRDLYELTFSAWDSGYPQMGNDKTVILRVLDENDNAPAFDVPDGSYEVHVSEDASPGTGVLQIRAHDLDEGINSVIRYSITPLDYLDAELSVQIHPVTGLVTTSGGLDYEIADTLILLAVACDMGAPVPLSSTATLTIHIEDANDNEPKFEKQVYNSSVLEHAPIGECFLQVSAMDSDSGQYGKIWYSLVDGFSNYGRPQNFRVEPHTGQVCVLLDIDRESGPQCYSCLVKAEDGGGLSTQAVVHVEIEDVNDNPPIFNPVSYMASISSHSLPGTEILSVVATDLDTGTYAEVLYELVTGDFSSLFTVDAATGAIYLIASLSYVNASSILLQVTAHDGGGLSSLNNADVTVNLVHSDLAPPIFEKSHYSFIIPEDAPKGSHVGSVKAINPSGMLNTKLGTESAGLMSYRISSGDPYGCFSVDPQLGIIRTTKELDHEAQPFVILVVQSHLGDLPVYSTSQVNVTVTDINDNFPVFPKTAETITISPNTMPGTALYIAHADDKDSGLNGMLGYSMKFNQPSLFTIDQNLGTVYLNMTFDMDRHHTYTLEITAKDMGQPSLSSTFTLTIDVVQNDIGVTLAFENLIYHAEVSELLSPGTQILQTRARGHTNRLNSFFVYSLELCLESVMFGIVQESGWLFLRKPLDYESTHNYNFKVYVTEVMGDKRSNATTSVIINVIDENDNPPAFISDYFFFTVEESSVPLGLLGKIEAVDPDSGRNGQMSYFLLLDGKHFRINSKTGELTNWVALDHEQCIHHQLHVMVTDHGIPRRNATAVVYVLVSDINDNAPQFQNMFHRGNINIQVLEAQQAGTLVTTVFADDPDAGANGTVFYSISSENGFNPFKIDSKTGELCTTEILVYSQTPTYKLTVSAHDQGKPALQSTAIINIQVIPLPREKSSFDLYTRLFIITEDFRPGQVIGSLRPRDQGVFINANVEYEIIEGDENSHFLIDSPSGDIYLAKELDYEITSNFLLKVDITETGTIFTVRNGTFFINIIVEDRNDHFPSFLQHFIVIGIQENLPIGTTLCTFNARDGDGSLPNRNLQYAIISNNLQENPFNIDPWTGTLSPAVLIDRETTPAFILTISATDQAENTLRRSGSLSVKVIVLDANDNSPVFLSSGTCYILEDAEVGSVVHHVVTQDPDAGKNGRVTYKILSGNEDHIFKLDSTSGLLLLASTLDRENRESYELTVVAQDEGTNALSSTQMLTAIIIDVNDDVPTLKGPLLEAAVAENKEPGELVYKMQATDRDSGMNSVLSYQILPGLGYEFFHVNAETGEITTTAMLDRELQERFILKVMVKDGGFPALSSTATVTCSILDENDNAPEFILPIHQLQLQENQEPGIVYTVQAIDKDTAENGTVRCHITDGNQDGYFAINGLSGDLSTTHSLDREKRSNFSLLLECHDLGSPMKYISTSLDIIVTDENDNSPVFTRSQYRASVREDLVIGSVVLQLTAVDVDEGPNGEVVYSLIDDTLGAFTIEITTGTVTTAKALDREIKSQYMFRVMASDCSMQSPRSSTVTVVVHIEDVNDNSPVFIQNPVNAYVSKATAVNQTIALMQAEDSDQGDNGTVLFSFTQPSALFWINPRTGEVMLHASLPIRPFTVQVLRVTVTDCGVLTRSTTALLLIHLQTEEKRLSCRQSEYNVSLQENSRTGASVITVQAYSPDLSGRSIQYNLFGAGETDTFRINPRTGEIAVKNSTSLDFEIKTKVQLIVLAESKRWIAYCQVTIAVQDVNDNQPRFEQAEYRTSAWEGQLFNTYIMQVFAADADSGLNGQVEYSIISGNINNAFIIDSVRGILATNAILDHEIVSSYWLVVQAADRGSPRLSSTAIVKIQVIDVNDNAPTIPHLEHIEIAENLPAGYVVTQISADDVDLNPTLSYSFSGKWKGRNKFTIDRYTGVIALREPLDFEDTTHYLLTIRVSDSVHEAEADLSITVLDANDNPPVFATDFYKVSISEHTPVHSQILTVSATDEDSEMNGRVSYRILPSSSLRGFYIDSSNGSIFMEKPWTYMNDSPTFTLLVEAKDDGQPSLYTIAAVEIQVFDINDHAPQFTQAEYHLMIDENATVGGTFLLLSANDRDWARDNIFADYYIISDNENKFSIETTTVLSEHPYKRVASLLLLGALDRETCSNYSLTILVSDRGAPPLNTSTVVLITVLDINDNTPEFTNLTYSIQVNESSPVETLLIQVSASDDDEGVHADLTYMIISGNEKGHFKLNSRSGLLHLVQPLDYEEDSEFILSIQATDGGTANRNIAFSVLIVSVLDDNDYTPFFIFPTLKCSVHENLPSFSPVCMVNALDFDAGPYGELSYSIESVCHFSVKAYGIQAGTDLFTIDSLTGELYTKQMFNYEVRNEYCLVVRAKDKGGKTATVFVQVHINGVDEFDPVFSQANYFFNLPENFELGQSVGQVLATDEDGGVDGVIFYTLFKHSQHFAVNKTSGIIYITATLHMTQNSVKMKQPIEKLWIRAHSPRLDSRSTTCNVAVNISRSLQASIRSTVHGLLISLTVSLAAFVLLGISLAGLIVRYKTKYANSFNGKKEISRFSIAEDNINDRNVIRCTPGGQPFSNNEMQACTMLLNSLQQPTQVDIQSIKEVQNPSKHSGSSGRGSSEEVTPEDEEIKWINEHPLRKICDSGLNERASHLPDSGIPQETDQMSMQSDEADDIAMVECVGSIHSFHDCSRGEKCGTSCIKNLSITEKREEEEKKGICLNMNRTKDSVFIADAQISVHHAIMSLLTGNEELHGSYNWDYLLNWEPKFQSLALVFRDIAELTDENVQQHSEKEDSTALTFPPPLITSVAQPGIKAIPPKMATAVLMPTLPKCQESWPAHSAGCITSAMTPSFSPSLSLLTPNTLTVSPFIGDAGVSVPSFAMVSRECMCEDDEIQL
ncbi:protocadherin-23 [Protopterus annectens]|uniref:protocadherin-23 n=1 Tax=Protopterus annectens TaxID=7888 RepID=UPI001CFBC85E|nr:protocadherin-23 [Protopterus annectens]